MIKLKTVNWGIIGCGDVTEVKSGPPLYRTRNSCLAAVMRRDRQKAAEYARRHQVARWYHDADQLINDPDVNAVYIATPPGSHREYTIRALQAKKPVYVEKPMALNHEECQQMIAASKKYRVPLFVAYYRRSLPYFLKIKELLDRPSIGRVIAVKATLYKHVDENLFLRKPIPWRFNPSISGGGLLFDLVSHQLDLLDFLFGPIHKIAALSANKLGLYPAEDLAGASFTFESGIFGSAFWCFALPENQNRDLIEIYGTSGRLSFSTFLFTPILLEYDHKPQTFEYPKPVHVQSEMIKSVVNQLTGKAPILSNAESASRTSYILDKIAQNFTRL